MSEIECAVCGVTPERKDLHGSDTWIKIISPWDESELYFCSEQCLIDYFMEHCNGEEIDVDELIEDESEEEDG